MHRRQFLEISALAAIAAPVKEVMGMHLPDHQQSAFLNDCET